MNIFNFLKSKLSILDVVGDYTTIKKAGLYWKGHCPFHHEKTASFTVSPHKEIFYCFGCHMGGDIITFIEKIENCQPLEAAKLLADRHNIDLPETLKTGTDSSHKQKDRYFELCGHVAVWCAQMAYKSTPVLQYLKNRHLSKSSVDSFALGYFPGGFSAIKNFISFMKQKNILVDDLLQANILVQGKTVLYSPFEERILFPIKDQFGRFCGFGGRIFKPHDERAKYYNSRESENFSKGSLLFGLDLAKKSIQKNDAVFLVEGYMDCIAMVQHDYTNTVATLGTACTIEHLKTLSRYAQNLYVLYDGDKAGKEAILRLTELCWQVNMEPNVINMPQGEDPASLLAKDTDLAPLLQEATDIFTFFIRTLGTNFAAKPLNEKLQTVRKTIKVIQRLDDPLKQDILLQKAADTLSVPLSSLRKELEKEAKSTKATPSFTPKETIKQTTITNLPKLEKKIFSAIMHNMQLLNGDNEEFLLHYLPTPLSTLLARLNNERSNNADLDFAHFFESLLPEEKVLISKVLLELEEEVSAEAFEQLVMQLRKKHWKLVVSDIKTKLARATNQADKENIEKMLHEFLMLKKRML